MNAMDPQIQNGIPLYGKAASHKLVRIITNLFCFIAQLKIVRFHLRTGGNVSNGATAHDSESWLLGDQLHVAAIIEGPPDAGRAEFFSQSHQVFGHLFESQQRAPS